MGSAIPKNAYDGRQFANIRLVVELTPKITRAKDSGGRVLNG